jgi:hypothetical protein
MCTHTNTHYKILKYILVHYHLVPRSRMCGAIPPLPQYVFMVWCLVKHRGNFTFTFYHVRKVQTCWFRYRVWLWSSRNNFVTYGRLYCSKI